MKLNYELPKPAKEMPLPTIQMDKIKAGTTVQLPLENSSDGCINYELEEDAILFRLSGKTSRMVLIHEKDLRDFLASKTEFAEFKY